MREASEEAQLTAEEAKIVRQFWRQRRWFFVSIAYIFAGVILMPLMFARVISHLAGPLYMLFSAFSPFGMLVQATNLPLVLDLNRRGLLPTGRPRLPDRYICRQCGSPAVAKDFEENHWQGLLEVYQRTKNIAILRVALGNNRDEFREAFLAFQKDQSPTSKKLSHEDARTMIEARLRWIPPASSAVPPSESGIEAH